jgi:1-acyl-sn-glycerol-3-phosphate acyltransferase
MVLFLVVGSILLPFDKRYMFLFWKSLSITLDFLTQKVANITYTIEGVNRDKKSAAAIYAMRHESSWETLILIHKFHDPIFVLKKELLNIPFFGNLAKKVGSIEVDRDSGAKSLINATRKVEAAIANGNDVIIFPEGKRAASGAHVEVKRGIALFYKKSNCPVIPVVHNSGRFWPRRGFFKKPGNITLRFLDPIAPGLSQEKFMDKLNEIFYSEIEKMNKS